MVTRVVVLVITQHQDLVVAAVEESEVQKQVVLLDLAVMLVEQTNTTLLHMVQVAVVVPVMVVKLVAHPKVGMVVMEYRFHKPS